MKIYIDPEKAPHGWIHVKDFESFKLLLDTIDIAKITLISFAYFLIEDDEYAPDGNDCAVYLIQVANGRKLPYTVVHAPGNRGASQIMDTLNYYINSYKYDNHCVRVHTKTDKEKLASLVL